MKTVKITYLDGTYPIGTISINKDAQTRIATINWGEDGLVKTHDEAIENAQRLVAAWNEHDKLKEENEALRESLQDIAQYYDLVKQTKNETAIIICAKAKAALK